MPSAVEAEGKALSPDLKKAAAEDARKQSEQAKNSLPTPDSTPGPDTERLEADKARRQAESVEASSKEASAEKTSDQEAAPAKVGKGKDQTGQSSETAPSGSSKTSTDAQEEFAPNAQGDEKSDDETDAMKLDESEALQPNNFYLQVYKKAKPYLGKLMENPEDEGAKSELYSLNKQIY